MINLFGLGKIIDAGGEAIDKIFTSDEERAQARATLEELRQRPQLLQIMANAEEAKHPSVFVSGWRPAAGWTCVVALAYQFVARPILEFTIQLFGAETCFVMELTKQCMPFKLVSLEIGDLLGLLIGMLGMGGIRSFEKIKEVARK